MKSLRAATAFGAGAGVERRRQPQLELLQPLFQHRTGELVVAVGAGEAGGIGTAGAAC